jgi:hypothetical protein
LTLRRNHFFRSSWKLEKAKNLYEEDVKYLDLDVLNIIRFENWMKCRRIKRNMFVLTPQLLDLSYWNTYNIGVASNESIFNELLFLCLYNHDICGFKNFRTDNMRNIDFWSLNVFEDQDHFNKNWKTAHLTDIAEINPHWNLYHYYHYDLKKCMR